MAVASQISQSSLRRLARRAYALRLRPGDELALAGLAAGTLGFLVFGPYIHAGGFIYDDWRNSATMHFHGFGGLLHLHLEIAPRRPLGSLYFAVVFGVLGSHEHWQLALAAGLHTVVGLLLFVLLRALDLDRVSAGAAAALTLLFPYSDSTWLWASAGQLELCVGCWLLGMIFALLGLRSEIHGWRWHGAALALYGSSILLYEETLLVVLLTGALYLLRAPSRVALRRWGADAVTSALCFLFFSSQLVKLGGGRDVHVALGVRATLHHMQTIADQGLTVAVGALVPFGSPERWAITAVVLVLIAGAGLVVRRTGDAAIRRDLVRWLLVACAGALVAIAGWAMLSAADAYYSPEQAGVGNRVNLLAGIGLPVLAMGLLGLVSTLTFAAVPHERRWAGALLTLLITAVLAAAYLNRVETDRGVWVQARRTQSFVLARLRQAIPPPPAGSTVIARGFGLYSAPGVPVFAASWDLDGAVELLWQDPSLRAWPTPPGGLTCGGAGMSVAGINVNPPASYGHTFLVDVRTRTASRIDSARQCRSLGT